MPPSNATTAPSRRTSIGPSTEIRNTSEVWEGLRKPIRPGRAAPAWLEDTTRSDRQRCSTTVRPASSCRRPRHAPRRSGAWTGSGEELGLGLQVVSLPCTTFTGHSGSTFGYKAAAFNDLEHDRQLVVLFNSVTLDDQVGGPETAAISNALLESAACP